MIMIMQTNKHSASSKLPTAKSLLLLLPPPPPLPLPLLLLVVVLVVLLLLVVVLVQKKIHFSNVRLLTQSVTH